MIVVSEEVGQAARSSTGRAQPGWLAVAGSIPAGRTTPPRGTRTLQVSLKGSRSMDKLEEDRQHKILQARLQDLEAENKRLRVELDWIREKFLDAETKLWFRQAATTSLSAQPNNLSYPSIEVHLRAPNRSDTLGS